MSALYAVVLDVFRQARASGLTATLLAVSILAAFVCGTAEFSSKPGGDLSVLFGSVPVLQDVPRAAGVRYLEFLLAGIVADVAGVLLALVWTAGFLPSFLDPSSASVLLAKPPLRAGLFLARFVGVIVFVGLQAHVFIGLTWAALGWATGEWAFSYWLCAPVLLLQFTAFFSFSVLMAVVTRSTAGCLIGSILFWLACFAMNYGRHAVVVLDASQGLEAAAHVANLGYWFLPKPADFSLILYDALDTGRFGTPLVDFQRLQERGLFLPWVSIVSSLAFAVVLLAVAVYEFVHADY
jgi:hypothetical protein